MGVFKTTKKLIENNLKLLTPILPIAWENQRFTPPADGSTYLRCNLQIGKPDDRIFGGGYYRENATFNVYVMDRLNIGTGNALDIAENIRTLFKKTSTFEEGSTRVQILLTPRIAGSIVTNDRLVIPLSIELVIENLV